MQARSKELDFGRPGSWKTRISVDEKSNFGRAGFWKTWLSEAPVLEASAFGKLGFWKTRLLEDLAFGRIGLCAAGISEPVDLQGRNFAVQEVLWVRASALTLEAENIRGFSP